MRGACGGWPPALAAWHPGALTAGRLTPPGHPEARPPRQALRRPSRSSG